MRMMLSRMMLFTLGVVALPLDAPAQFTPSKVPTHEGVRVTADLPVSQHQRNVGGSDGAGLCVYTSAWHAAMWQNIVDVYGFRAWMQRRPGGSYPEKFDATIEAYCRERGIPVPPYVQHTGGDVDFLKLTLKTGRMVSVTYCGVDDFYRGEVIAHMVNLLYLDDSLACILDNNRPGVFLWMSAPDFVARWRGVQRDGRPYMVRVNAVRWMPVGGGWAFTFLAPPPAPYPEKPVALKFEGVLYGQCPGGACPLPGLGGHSVLVPPLPSQYDSAFGQTPVGSPPTPDHEWGYFENANYKGFGWRLKVAGEPEAKGPAVGQSADPFPGGIDPSKLRADETYSISGQQVKKSEAMDALVAGGSLTDDSTKWHVAAVGDAAFCARVNGDVAKLPKDVREKLHVQCYASGDWHVAQFDLSPGVTLRKPATNRVGSNAGAIAPAQYTSDALKSLLAPVGMPTPDPMPEPKPKPDEPKPDEPAPSKPDQSTPSMLTTLAGLAIAVLALILAVFRR